MDDDTTDLSRERDARRASARIRRRLEARARSGPREWAGMLTRLRDRLAEVSAHPVVARDAQAQAILASMTKAQDMVEISAHVDRLGERIAALMARQPAQRAVRPQPIVLPPPERGLRPLAGDSGARMRLRL